MIRINAAVSDVFAFETFLSYSSLICCFPSIFYYSSFFLYFEHMALYTDSVPSEPQWRKKIISKSEGRQRDDVCDSPHVAFPSSTSSIKILCFPVGCILLGSPNGSKVLPKGTVHFVPQQLVDQRLIVLVNCDLRW